MRRRSQEGRLRKARYYNDLAGKLTELAALEAEKDVRKAMLNLAKHYEELREILETNARVH